jgi:hypothetical protein
MKTFLKSGKNWIQKSLISFSTAVRFCLPLPFFALSAMAADVQFNFSDFRGSVSAFANTNVIITIKPIGDLTVNGVKLALKDWGRFTNDTAGGVLVTGMFAGTYSCTLSPSRTAETTFSILVPDTNATLSAWTLRVTSTNSTTTGTGYAYPTSVSDAKYALKSNTVLTAGITWTNNYGSNKVVGIRTNGALYLTDAGTGSGGTAQNSLTNGDLYGTVGFRNPSAANVEQVRWYWPSSTSFQVDDKLNDTLIFGYSSASQLLQLPAVQTLGALKTPNLTNTGAFTNGGTADIGGAFTANGGFTVKSGASTNLDVGSVNTIFYPSGLSGLIKVGTNNGKGMTYDKAANNLHVDKLGGSWQFWANGTSGDGGFGGNLYVTGSVYGAGILLAKSDSPTITNLINVIAADGNGLQMSAGPISTLSDSRAAYTVWLWDSTNQVWTFNPTVRFTTGFTNAGDSVTLGVIRGDGSGISGVAYLTPFNTVSNAVTTLTSAVNADSNSMVIVSNRVVVNTAALNAGSNSFVIVSNTVTANTTTINVNSNDLVNLKALQQNFLPGSNITLTTNNTTNVTIASTGGGAVNFTNLTGYLPVNVRKYGAVGDGTTEDTASFSNAFVAAGTTNAVYVPAGTYAISPLVYPGLKLYGDGHLSQLKLFNPTNKAILLTATNAGVAIENLYFFGNTNAAFPVATAPLFTTALVHSAISSSRVIGNKFVGWETALMIVGDADTTTFTKSGMYQQNHFSNNWCGTFFGDNNAAEYIIFQGNEMHSNYYHLRNKSAGNVMILNNVTVGAAWCAYEQLLSTSAKGNCTVMGNVFNHGNLIYFNNSGSTYFANNTCQATGNIWLTGATKVDMVDNVWGSSWFMAFLGANSLNSFRGNRLTSTTVGRSGYTNVSQCIFRNNYLDGIPVYDDDSINAINSKAPFFTNYTALASDGLLFCTGTNQVITLPNCTNFMAGAAKFYDIATANINGSVIITNATGAQTISGNLGYTNAGNAKVRFFTDGVNWY